MIFITSTDELTGKEPDNIIQNIIVGVISSPSNSLRDELMQVSLQKCNAEVVYGVS